MRRSLLLTTLTLACGPVIKAVETVQTPSAPVVEPTPTAPLQPRAAPPPLRPQTLEQPNLRVAVDVSGGVRVAVSLAALTAHRDTTPSLLRRCQVDDDVLHFESYGLEDWRANGWHADRWPEFQISPEVQVDGSSMCQFDVRVADPQPGVIGTFCWSAGESRLNDGPCPLRFPRAPSGLATLSPRSASAHYGDEFAQWWEFRYVLRAGVDIPTEPATLRLKHRVSCTPEVVQQIEVGDWEWVPQDPLALHPSESVIVNGEVPIRVDPDDAHFRCEHELLFSPWDGAQPTSLGTFCVETVGAAEDEDGNDVAMSVRPC